MPTLELPLFSTLAKNRQLPINAKVLSKNSYQHPPKEVTAQEAKRARINDKIIKNSFVSCVGVKTFLLTPCSPPSARCFLSRCFIFVCFVLLPLVVAAMVVLSMAFVFWHRDRGDGNDAEIILACTAEKGTAARNGSASLSVGRRRARARACLEREQPAEETARRTDYLLDTRPREINCRAVFA